MRPRTAAGAALCTLVIAAAIAGPVLWRYGAEQPDFMAALAPPSPAHPLGTDDLGRDVLARIFAGGRVSLLVAAASVFGAGSIGSTIGLVAGFVGGWTDRVLMRCMDVLLAFPGILLALGVTAALGASASHAALAIALVNLPVFARLGRAQARIVAGLDYVAAGRAVGRSEASILITTVAPNALSPLLVQASLLLASSIITESVPFVSRPRRAAPNSNLGEHAARRSGISRSGDVARMVSGDCPFRHGARLQSAGRWLARPARSARVSSALIRERNAAWTRYAGIC